MSILSVLTLFGGLAFFLYGMHVMSTGLEKVAGGKLENVLKKLTSNPFKSLLLGAGITIAIQSSSAMTVMLVGLVNSGIMELGQTIGVIMGSNIGTTLTAWILSLAGIQSDNIFISLLKPEAFSPVLAFIGILMIMLSKKVRRRDVGGILVGFAILMYGMQLMSNAVSPLKDMPQFKDLLTAFTNPILGVIVGALFTGIIQSSAASVGILQALSLTGSITYGMAMPVIMGQNIGTCVTALLSSIGVNKNARRVAVVHISFNIIGTIVFLIVFYSVNAFMKFAFVNSAINPVGIAFVHTVFNVFTTIILLPFSKGLEKIARFVIRDDAVEEEPVLLDDRLITTPAIALASCKRLTMEMAGFAKDGFISALTMVNCYNESTAETIEENEAKIDRYQDALGTYLVKISRESLSVNDSHETSTLLHSINDFERIGDHACNMVRVVKDINTKDITFSDSANSEINILTAALREILELTGLAFDTENIATAKKIEPLEQVIDKMIYRMKENHILRLQAGECKAETGFIFSDLLTNCERVADHCSNVAVCLIRIADDTFDTHEYLKNMKAHGDADFDKMYNEFSEKYNA